MQMRKVKKKVFKIIGKNNITRESNHQLSILNEGSRLQNNIYKRSTVLIYVCCKRGLSNKSSSI